MKSMIILALSLCSVAACAPSESMPHVQAPQPGPSSLAPQEDAKVEEKISTTMPEPSDNTVTLTLPSCTDIDTANHPSLRHYCESAVTEVRSLASSAADAVKEAVTKTGEAAKQETGKFGAESREAGQTVLDDLKDEINKLDASSLHK